MTHKVADEQKQRNHCMSMDPGACKHVCALSLLRLDVVYVYVYACVFVCVLMRQVGVCMCFGGA